MEQTLHDLGVLDLAYPDLPEDLQMLMYLLSLYLFLSDTDYILATLAAAVAKDRADYDPLWLMLVSPSSSGKGEALRLLNRVRDTAFDDLSLAGLLGKGGTGALVPLNGQDALAVITDFSTLLGDPKMSGSTKAEVFNALRTIYDGSFRRDIHPEPLSWVGRLSLVAACTPAIDTFAAHADSLGTRWLYFRQAERDAATKRLVTAQVMKRTDLHERRDDACVKATRIIEAARGRVQDVELPENLDAVVCDVATLVAYGRASVPRDFRGEVDGVVSVEDPGRIAGQLRLLGIGLAALELTDETIIRVVRRAALGSMPQARARVIDVLARAEGPKSEWRISKQGDVHIKVAQRALDDWKQVHFVDSEPITGLNGLPATGWWLTSDGETLAKSGLAVVHETDKQAEKES